MTNANPLVAPTFGLYGMLGTNPVAVAIPTGKQPPFVADFATAPIARGQLDVLEEKGKEAPEGLLQDKTGKPTTTAGILKKGGSLLTLGGNVEHGGHKGFCMTAIVDILSAVLPGANFGPTVVPTLGYVKDKTTGDDRGIGHFFGAIRIDAFQTADEFKAYMDEWVETFRKAETVPGQERVIIPGDPERISEQEKMQTGIEISGNTLNRLKTIGKEFGIDFPVKG
jgi:LDH2 family malate/lactate/ureidoglycolate dehydrogenase